MSDALTSAHRSQKFKSTAGLPAGYFGDLAVFDYLPQFGPLLGGHMGSGPPSGAGTLGAAAATYVLTNANIRSNALTVRFIGVSPCASVSLTNGTPMRARIIQS